MADLIQFDVRSGVRIGQAIRWVEEQVPRAKPLAFAPLLEQKSRAGFRICTYTGEWQALASKAVTFKNQTSNTVSATNLFWPSIPDLGTRDCAIAKDGTSWYLIQVQWNAADVFTSATLSDTAITFGTDRGYTLGTAASVSISVTTCSTATAS